MIKPNVDTLFCKHNYVWIKTMQYYMDDTSSKAVKYIYKCSKCGKEKTKVEM